MSALRQTTGPARALLLAGVFVLVAETVAVCLYGTSVYDEGGYLYEGWATVAHGQLPFRDFFAKLPPLLYYLYGAGQALCGPSLLVGRLQSALFMFAGLALSVSIVRRLAGPWAGVLLVWLLAGNPFALNYYLHAYAVAPTAFFVCLTLALLILPRPRPAALLAANAALAGVLLCRQDMLPLVLVLWVYTLWKYPLALPVRIGGVAFSWAVSGLVLLPFVLMAPENVLWSMSVGTLGPQVPSMGSYGEATPASAQTIAWHVAMLLRAYAGIILLLVVGAPFMRARDTTGEAPGTAMLQPLGWMLATALLFWLSHVPAAAAIGGGNVYYLLDPYIFFLVAMPAAAMLVLAVRSLSGPQAPAAARALALVGAFAVAMAVFTGPGPRLEFSLQRPTALERIGVGGRALARTIPRGSTIFTVDDPHQFLQAELLLPGALTHQLFSYRESPDTALLRRVHMYNDEIIRQWLTGGAQYAVISAEARSFMRDSGRYSGGRRLDSLVMGLVGANYELVAEVPGTWAGPMSIYRWKGRR